MVRRVRLTDVDNHLVLVTYGNRLQLNAASREYTCSRPA
jgi:hypothetical protein